MNSIERPLLLATPHATPVIAHAGAPSVTISPLFSPVDAVLSIPALSSSDDVESPQRDIAASAAQRCPRGTTDTMGEGNSEREESGSERLHGLDEDELAEAPRPRFHDPARPRFHDPAQFPREEPRLAIGIPRVIGVPVEAAALALPDNCCEQRCGAPPIAELTQAKRRALAKSTCFTALGVFAMCFCADVLTSFGSLPWQDLDLEATEKMTTSFFRRCVVEENQPFELIVAATLYILAAVATVMWTVPILVMSRGCILCCAPASCCGTVSSAAALLVSSLFLVAVSVPLYFWLVYGALSDLDSCAACHAASASVLSEGGDQVLECEVSLRVWGGDLLPGLFIHTRGLGAIVGVTSACAVAMAGYYCVLVPSAIRSALGTKARNLMSHHTRDMQRMRSHMLM